jgi:hypothetical protein
MQGLSVSQIERGVCCQGSGASHRLRQGAARCGWTLSTCILWRRFDRGLAEEEGLARFQRRHCRDGAPIRQAPGLAQFSRIFLREAALGSACGPGLPGTNGVSGLAVQQLQLSARVS